MPYKYLGDIATSDVAFKAWGKDEKELFSSSCDALMNVLVSDISAIKFKERRDITVEEDDIEMLLYKFLQDIVCITDTENILLRVSSVNFFKKNSVYGLSAELTGEFINRERHELGTDIKAVTLHKLKVEKKSGIFEATVVVDI